MDLESRYQLLEKIGTGSYATVFRARDLELGREVAIRQINPVLLERPEQLERYWQEAQLLASLPETKRNDPDVAAVRASLELAEKSQEAAGRMPELESRVRQNPADHEARFELALAAYAQHQSERAIDELLEIVRRSRSWKEDAARKELVKIFDALGPTHPATIEGRQRLSAVLFS